MTRDTGELRVFDTPGAVAQALADLFVTTGRAAISERGSFAVSLAGGTTPKAAYTLLGTPPYATSLDWRKVQIFFGDERCVPPDDAQSNYKMAREAFLDAVRIPDGNVHRMRGEDDPVDAAAAYGDELTRVLGEQPRFDMIMLGMGPDGHTASLFPGTDPAEDEQMLVRAVYAPSQSQWRITLTPRVLNAARLVVFSVEGAAKAAMLARVRNGEYAPSRTPSQIVAPHSGRLVWLVDKAAAGGS